MGYTGSMRYFVVLMLFLIIGSLVSGLYYVMRDDHKSNRACLLYTSDAADE